MLKEAAEMMGVSHYSLRRYISRGTPNMQPSKVANMGGMRIYLYTKEDVDRMRKTREGAGKIQDYCGYEGKNKYTEEQRNRRSLLYAKRTYWRGVHKKAVFMEDLKRVANAKDRITGITKELDEM